MRLTRPRHLILALCLFLLSFGLRRSYFCGFILGDDPQEFQLLERMLLSGPDFQDQLNLRIGVWLLNYPVLALFGVSETTFFLPTWIISSAFAAAAYALLVRWRYGSLRALVGGLVVASAPFEILTGTVRANDLFLAGAMVIGLLCLVFLDQRPLLQGAALAACLWFGLYVKVWALYLMPALALYYLVRFREPGGWRSPLAFLTASLLLHGATGLWWQATIGAFVPFIAYHPPTTPIAAQHLGPLFAVYPLLLLRGSEFGTTLFGAVPYVWLGLLVLKTTAWFFPCTRLRALRPDAVDLGLLSLSLSFFLLLNFFPTSFSFDQYYSIPRIFRYLTPFSFPMTLHVAKMLCDASRIGRPPIGRLGPGPLTLGLFVPLIVLNLALTEEATQPGRLYRQMLLAVVDDVRRTAPPRLTAESWLLEFLRSVYVKEYAERLMGIPLEVNGAKKYEAWLQEVQTTMPVRTLLVTGLGSYVHYGAHYDGFRLSRFSRPLHPNWKLVKDYGMLTYLPEPEPARLWVLSVPILPGDAAVPATDLGSQATADGGALYARGLEAVERGDCPGARVSFTHVMESDPVHAVDARYFYAVCFFREGDWTRAMKEFGELLHRHPNSQWTAAAHWHTGMALKEIGDYAGARERLEYVVEHFPNDQALAASSRTTLATLPAGERGWLATLTETLRRALVGD